MKISLTDAGKRFNRDWIFRHLNFTFENSRSYAIIGPNGSGKSTLLQLIAGSLDITEGKIHWAINNESIEDSNVFRSVSISAPYLEVIEEMTAIEFLNFHKQFKPFLQNINTATIIEEIGLSSSKNKQIRYYSSGMKQRIKLAQAIFSDTPVVLLDEPCTNLDENGYQLYYSLVDKFCKKRLLIVSSNEEKEIVFCQEKLDIQSFKR
ncbi:MAG TPA: ATP-binding cassette domain-containing protein [Chitinophagaceae bacterium]|nr:ATP-binding cassette domain-containing protein [Chitinophagaceae bacterium]